MTGKRYNTPTQGSQDWHRPLNNNFERLEKDVEFRDIEENKGNYTPEQGAKFFATDTGAVYTGTGNAWELVGHVSLSGGGDVGHFVNYAAGLSNEPINKFLLGDGESLEVVRLSAPMKHAPQHKLTITSTGTECNYEFSVTSDLKSAKNFPDGSHESISGTSASGWVSGTGNKDTFFFSGNVESFNFAQGSADVTIDGESWDPSNGSTNLSGRMTNSNVKLRVFEGGVSGTKIAEINGNESKSATDVSADWVATKSPVVVTLSNSTGNPVNVAPKAWVNIRR